MSDTGFVVEGVDTEDGGRTLLAERGSSAEARQFLRRYISAENAGGWDLIEVHDVRREDDPELLWYWSRELELES